MYSATLPGDSESDGDGAFGGAPLSADPDEAPTPGPHIIETFSSSAQNGLSSGTQASVSLADESGHGDDETNSSSTSGKMSSRAYQLEMLDKSLKQNVIVAVRQPPSCAVDIFTDDVYRWTLEVARPRCKC